MFYLRFITWTKLNRCIEQNTIFERGLLWQKCLFQSTGVSISETLLRHISCLRFFYWLLITLLSVTTKSITNSCQKTIFPSSLSWDSQLRASNIIKKERDTNMILSLPPSLQPCQPKWNANQLEWNDDIWSSLSLDLCHFEQWDDSVWFWHCISCCVAVFIAVWFITKVTLMYYVSLHFSVHVDCIHAYVLIVFKYILFVRNRKF